MSLASLLNKIGRQDVTYANAVQGTYGVPVSVTLATYILESNYGKSNLAKKANNYFGIKGSNNGLSYTSSDGTKWRKYLSKYGSFLDYGKLISKSGLYDSAKSATNVKEYVYAIAETYAPSSDGNNNWAEKILNIIDYYGLVYLDGSSVYAKNNPSGWKEDSKKVFTVSNALDTASKNIVGTVSGVDKQTIASSDSVGDIIMGSDTATSILSAAVKFITIAFICVMAIIFFMSAFDLHLPKKGDLMKKVVSNE